MARRTWILLDTLTSIGDAHVKFDEYSTLLSAQRMTMRTVPEKRLMFGCQTYPPTCEAANANGELTSRLAGPFHPHNDIADGARRHPASP